MPIYLSNTCICVSVYVYLRMWKPEVSVWCCPQVLSILVIEMGFLTSPDFTNFYVGFKDSILLHLFNLLIIN